MAREWEGGKGLPLESHHEAACETYLHGAEGVGLRVRRPQFTSWLLCLGKSLNLLESEISFIFLKM